MTASPAPQVFFSTASQMAQGKGRDPLRVLFRRFVTVLVAFAVAALLACPAFRAGGEGFSSASARVLWLRCHPFDRHSAVPLGSGARSSGFTELRRRLPPKPLSLADSLVVGRPRLFAEPGDLERREDCLKGRLEGGDDGKRRSSASSLFAPDDSAAWTAVPSDFASVPFSQFSLLPPLERRLRRWGVCSASAVQASVLQEMLEGRNVAVAAATGSGKTLAVLIALAQHVLLKHSRGFSSEQEETRRPLAVAVVPTRELAMQVLGWARRLLFGSGLSAGLLLGSRGVLPVQGLDSAVHASAPGKSAAEPSAASPRKRATPALFVGTPSALASVAQLQTAQSSAFFARLGVLAIDEADLLLGGSFKKPMDAVLRECRRADKEAKQRTERGIQFILAAATLPEGGPKWALEEIQRNIPRLRVVTADCLHRHPERLELEFQEVSSAASFDEKLRLLRNALRLNCGEDTAPQGADGPTAPEGRLRRALVFCNSSKEAAAASEALRALLGERGGEASSKVVLLTAALPPQARSRALRSFFKGTAQVLVCTDAAARGLHLPAELVVQFDFATSAVSHLHRVGRVARLGRAGKALCFVANSQQRALAEKIKAAYEAQTAKASLPTASSEASLAPVFSRKRSFAKKLKKKARLEEGTARPAAAEAISVGAV